MDKGKKWKASAQEFGGWRQDKVLEGTEATAKFAS